MKVRTRLVVAALAVSMSMVPISWGCGGPQGGGPPGSPEAEREANRRALEQVVSRSRERAHPMDVLRGQLEEGWLARHWVEELHPRDVLLEVVLIRASEAECSRDGIEPEVCFEVAQLGPAARRLREHGLMVGDVLVHINGRTMGRPEDFTSLLEGLAEEQEVHVAIVRGGEHLDLRAEIRDE